LRFVKNETVIGIIGNTHGVSSDKNPATIAAHKYPINPLSCGFVAPLLFVVVDFPDNDCEPLFALPPLSFGVTGAIAGEGEAVGETEAVTLGEGDGEADAVGDAEAFGNGETDAVVAGVAVGEACAVAAAIIISVSTSLVRGGRH
jgi:hypothetical protein